MGVASIEAVRRLEEQILECPQEDIPTQHVIHAGLYARTIRIPAGVVLSGAEMKRSTLLIVSGKISAVVDNGEHLFDGYHVIAASAGRKTAWIAHQDTTITMLFPTASTTVEACEDEFTDEADRLFSRQGVNEILITGE